MAKSVLNTQSTEDMGGAKFRTTPIASTITHVKQLPKSAIVYKCAASSYWQFRVYLEGTQRKRSTKKTDLADAQREAKLIYADMLQNIHGSDKGKLKLSSKRTLNTVAATLWQKQAVMITQGELNAQKNKFDTYVYQKHIQPFFSDTELKDITAAKLEEFKLYLAKRGLKKSSQKSYFTVISKLLQEAVKQQYIHYVPLMPRVRMDDEARGYFNPVEYTKLWKRAKKLIGKTVPVYRDKDVKNGKVRTGAKPYRSIKITKDCYNLILFMRNTYVRPTDIKVLKHRHIKQVTKDGIDFLELRHPATKRHHRVMTSTEDAPNHYKRIRQESIEDEYGEDEHYVFMPQFTNRDYALKELTRQFDVVLQDVCLKHDINGKRRTLYSLRHTAIVQGIHHGISEQTLAMNARTSVDMIDRFYGSHIKSVLDRGTEVVDSVKAKRERYAKTNADKEES